jgi:hypothetical protein
MTHNRTHNHQAATAEGGLPCALSKGSVSQTAWYIEPLSLGNTFKERYNGHRSDIRHQKNRHNTTLADLIWNLNDGGKDYELEWNLVERAPSFNPITQKCRVCLKEKTNIL